MDGIFRLAPGESLVLGSTSPRRKQLLENLGAPFSIISPDIEEPIPEPGANPADFALACACLKNRACAPLALKSATIITADTIVAIDNQILGKPGSEEEALAMLCKLNGAIHTVYTCFCIRLGDGREMTGKCHSAVRFHNWPRDVLAAYATSGESLDKAGAYAIQGRGVFLAAAIDGSWTTVVGLPMTEITACLLQNNVLLPVPGVKSR